MVTLAQITMNAGDDIPGSTLKYTLDTWASGFERVLIVDGHLTEEARGYYEKFDNVEVLDSPWQDNHTPQYERFMKELADGEWCLYLDDDESPSQNLVLASAQIADIVARAEGGFNQTTIFALPSILYITENGTRYYRALHRPYPDDPRNGGHTKQILFQNRPFTTLLTSPPPAAHVNIRQRIGQPIYAPEMYYYHFKSAEAYIINDCLFAMMNAKQERYTEQEAAEFKAALEASGIYTLKDFRQRTEAGEWSQSLKKFAEDHRKDTDRPISRLYWWYYLIANPHLNEIESETWDRALKIALADEWYDTYTESKRLGDIQAKLAGKVDITSDDYLDIYSTPRSLVSV